MKKDKHTKKLINESMKKALLEYFKYIDKPSDDEYIFKNHFNISRFGKHMYQHGKVTLCGYYPYKNTRIMLTKGYIA